MPNTLTNPFEISSLITTVNNKQDTLISGTNIKTINNTSLLGSGNIEIQGGGGGEAVWGSITGTLSNQTDLQNALNAKAADNSVIKTSGNQTATGIKTFSDGIVTTLIDSGSTANSLTISSKKDLYLSVTTGNSIYGKTPDTSAIGTEIATAAFVKAQGYTSNAGTITGITMNGSSKGTSGVVNLGTVATSDTKNTAGSTDTSSKIYLVGATSQAANPQTYSHDTVFVDTAGCINSVTPAVNNDSTKVVTTAYINTKFQVVTSLPASPDSNTFYFIKE